MQAISLTDGPFAADFFPFSLTRPVADIRCGILTIRQKWEYYFTVQEAGKAAIEIPGNVLPDSSLAEAIRRNDAAGMEKALAQATRLRNITDIIRRNEQEIRRDFNLICRGRLSAPVPASNRIMLSLSDPVPNDFTGRIFMEEGAVLEHCILNVSEGPVYIGRNALVMEGSMIRGPFALGEQSVLKMGARIYGGTSTGPSCTIGGELKNTVIFGYSNKAHEGYLGDSVIGEWCNLGGGSSASNINNLAGTVKLWNPLKKEYMDGGLKCGLFMGDYSRSAINTSFNTGTTVGVCANVFGRGLTPSYLSSFSWGFDAGEIYDFKKAIQHIQQWKQLKNKNLSEAEITQLKAIFDKKIEEQSI